MCVKDGLEPCELNRFQRWEDALCCFECLVQKIKFCSEYYRKKNIDFDSPLYFEKWVRVEAGVCNKEGDPIETIECYENSDAKKA